jgi:hypothetical protein
MVRTLYFSKEGQHRRSFWRCAVCRAHHNVKDSAGVMVTIGNQVVCMVCPATCAGVVCDVLEKVMPDPLPDVDEKTGQLLP